MTANWADRARLLRFMEVGRRDPIRWMERVFGCRFWERQQEIIRSVREHRTTIVESCHGIGKSFTLARIGLNFVLSFPRSRVITTAPTFRQVRDILWAEVHQAHAGAVAELGGKLTQTAYEVAPGWFMVGFSTNKPERFAGHHAPYILVIVDEGYGVPEAIYDAVSGALSGGYARLLIAGNPTDPAAYPAKLAKKVGADGRPLANVIRVSAFDTPNFTAFGITLGDIRTGAWREKLGDRDLPAPWLVTPEWVAEKHAEWGEESPAWQARVLGRLPDASSDTIIPLAWVEAAVERWKASVAADKEPDPDLRRQRQSMPEYVPAGDPEEAGIDWAEFGDDETVLAIRQGRRLLPLKAWSKREPMEAVGLAVREIQQQCRRFRQVLVKSDAIGVGAGPTSRLRELGMRVSAVKVSQAPRNRNEFEDMTTELWFHLRELLRPDNPHPIALPPDDKLIGDLTGRKYRITSSGKLQAEPKDQYRKRLGRSPDRGDAVVLAFAPVRAGEIVPKHPAWA